MSKRYTLQQIRDAIDEATDYSINKWHGGIDPNRNLKFDMAENLKRRLPRFLNKENKT